MKVESKKEARFEPIVITLETKEELESFYQYLEMDKGESLVEHCREEKLPIDKIDNEMYGLWSKIDDIARERGYGL